MISVSVAMATYNGARFIREQLDSIALQTVLPAELVITDDASTDGTIDVAELFAETAPFPVRIHRNPSRLGYRANFMHNLSLCMSPIIAFCDQDDIWHASKLERTLALFDDPEVLLVCHEAWLIDGNGKRGSLARIYDLPERNPPLSLWPLRSPLGFAMVFRRDILIFDDLWHGSIDNLEPANRAAHDQWIFALASVFGTIVALGEPLASYRQHENNTYGVGRRGGTVRDRVSGWIVAATTEYASFSVAAQSQAVVMTNALGRLQEPWRERALLAAVSYRDLARHCSLRSSAYRSTRVGTRLGAWLGLVREGAYAGTRWAFGRKTALKDLFWLFLPRKLVNALVIDSPAQVVDARADLGLARHRV